MIASSPAEDWRPGLPRRADNFGQVCDLAVAWSWQPGVTVGRICDAITLGTPDLSMSERGVLAAYAAHLNQERLEQSRACVWPSARLISAYLGCSESTVRSHRKSLEAKGYMVRDYNRANRPAGDEAFDLAPLAARLGELEANRDGARSAVRALREAWQTHVVDLGRYRAQAPESPHLEQSSQNASSSVRGSDAPMARSNLQERPSVPAAQRDRPKSSTNRPANATASANCSPGGASGFSGEIGQPTLPSERLKAELQAAVRLSKRVAALVPPHLLENPYSASPDEIEAWAAAANELLPEAARNNDLSFKWAYKRHGSQAFVMLALALEDPAVERPSHYFGWMASRDARNAPDLRFNLDRVLKMKGSFQPPPAPQLMDAPGMDDPSWTAIREQIRKVVREGAFGSWFGRLGFHGISDGVLALSSPSGTVIDTIHRNYLPVIVRAAVQAGFDVERCMISLRKAVPS